MTLNLERIGIPIAIIKPKNDKSRDEPIIFYLANKEQKKQVKNPINHFTLDDYDADHFEFQLIPFVSKDNGRNVLYVTGQGGAGKSWFVKNYLLEFKKMFPSYKIYLFSSLSEDKGSLDKVKNLHRVKIDDEFCNTDWTIDDFKNCVVIYDDTDNISDKKIKAKLKHIEDIILDTGRHAKCFYIRTSHLPTNGKDTKHILAESHSVTIYPSTLGNRSMNYLLGEYLGLSKKQIEKVKKMGDDSRWVTFFTSISPRVIMTEQSIMLQNHLKD